MCLWFIANFLNSCKLSARAAPAARALTEKKRENILLIHFLFNLFCHTETVSCVAVKQSQILGPHPSLPWKPAPPLPHLSGRNVQMWRLINHIPMCVTASE